MNTRHIAEEHRLAHWAGIVHDRAESGLSIRAYCESAGFHENNYYYWQKKLREAACEELAKIQGKQANMTPTSFMEIKVAPQNAHQSQTGSPQSQVCIESAKVRITAGGDYPVDKLVALIREVTLPC